MQDRVSKAQSARLVRKQILITPEQAQELRARAVAAGRPEAEIVREAIDAWLASQKPDEDDWKAAFREVFGLWKDRTDLDELYKRRRQQRALRRQRSGPKS